MENPSLSNNDQDKSRYYIPLLAIFLVAGFIILALIIVRDELSQVRPTVPCPAGLCATNIFTGDKTCPPSPSDTVQVDPTFGACNPPNACTATGRSPCVYETASLGTSCPGQPNYTGVCMGRGECRCTSRVYCPDFATVYFEDVIVTNSGVPDPSQTFNAFVQKTVWTDPTNRPRQDQPLSPGPFGRVGSIACGISSQNLDRIWPPINLSQKNNCIRGTLTFSERDRLWYCTHVPENLTCGANESPVLLTNGQYTCRNRQSLLSI